MSKISQIKVDNYILNLIITILVVYGIIYLYNLMSNLLFIKFFQMKTNVSYERYNLKKGNTFGEIYANSIV